jgi:antirestriction protein
VTAEEYKKSAAALRNDYGDLVEEFEIQFIDGDNIDCDLAKAISLNQANFARYFEIIDEWEEWEKRLVILAVGECGYQFDDDTSPTDFDIDIYDVDSMRELAEQFVEEGLYGDIPESLQFYIDYEAIARDLSVEYSETVIAGSSVIYRCG